MKPVNKKTLLDQLEAKVETHIAEAIRDFQNQDHAFLNKLSATGGWSIAQCLDHLNSYGDYYLPRIHLKIEEAMDHPGNESFSGTWLGNYFTRMMDPETGRKKYKAFKGHIPGSNLDASKVVAEFIRQQEDILVLIRKARSKDLDAIKVPISISSLIKLRLGDVFQFIIAHNERHMLQAKRNLSPTVIPG
jgi:hypothetical protein